MVHAVYVAGGWRCVTHGWICHSKWVILPSMQLSKPIPFEVKTDKEGRRVHLPFSLTWGALANLASFLCFSSQRRTETNKNSVIYFSCHTFYSPHFLTYLTSHHLLSFPNLCFPSKHLPVRTKPPFLWIQAPTPTDPISQFCLVMVEEPQKKHFNCL